MTLRITITPKASEDIDELFAFAYIAQDNYDVALKFFDAIRLTFSQLAKNPGIGSSCKSVNSRLFNMRKWAVKGFARYLIFYLDTDEYIEIVRVIHAARDISAIFEEE